ncbi:MAG: PfkB family carbohydrate kinase [Thermomicrobiales bacterium]
MSGRVIVVGSINTDLVVRAKTLPRPGETIIGEGFAIAGGGKGANAAVAAARMGARVTMIARVGDDDFGRARLADLAADGIDVAGVRQLANTASGVALITVDAHGENTIVVASGANMLLSLDALDSLAFGPDDVLMTQIEVPFATTEAALRLARDAGATTVLNTAPYNPDCAAMLPLVDVLIANEIEAADLIGWSAVTAENAAEAIGTILGRGPRAVALTLGAHGAAAVARPSRHRPPGHRHRHHRRRRRLLRRARLRPRRRRRPLRRRRPRRHRRQPRRHQARRTALAASPGGGRCIRRAWRVR